MVQGQHKIHRLASALTVAYSNTGDCKVIVTAVPLLVLHLLVHITSGIPRHTCFCCSTGHLDSQQRHTGACMMNCKSVVGCQLVSPITDFKHDRLGGGLMAMVLRATAEEDGDLLLATKAIRLPISTAIWNTEYV